MGRRGRAIVGERTEILEAGSRKQATVYWQAIRVNNLLAVWCMYQLLLSSGIFCSVDILPLFLKKTVQLSSAFSVLFFVLKFRLIKKSIEKNTAVPPFYIAFFQWTFKM